MAKVKLLAGAAALGGAAVLSPAVYCTARNAMILRRREREAEAREMLRGEAYPSHLEKQGTPRDMATITGRIKEIPMHPKPYGGVVSTLLFALPDAIPMLSECRKATAGKVYRYPADFKRIEISSEDGTPISAVVGIHKDGRPRPALIMVHGLFGSKNLWFSQQVVLAAYYGWGYNAMAIDLRFFGESKKYSDAPGTGGWKEGQDILAAARYLKSLPEVTSVGAMGGSMGAASTMLAAAQDPEHLLDGGTIAWHGYGDIGSQIRFISTRPGLREPFFGAYLFFQGCLGLTLGKDARRWPDFESYLFDHCASYYGITPEELLEKSSPAAQLHRVEVPFLAINSDDDPIVPAEQGEILEKAAASNPWTEVLRYPVGGHCAFAVVDKVWMAKVVRSFYDYWAWI
jgi:pimeloyl-ACP methyl ester carboxylesterase